MNLREMKNLRLSFELRAIEHLQNRGGGVPTETINPISLLGEMKVV
jgi:hypothetical protein